MFSSQQRKKLFILYVLYYYFTTEQVHVHSYMFNVCPSYEVHGIILYDYELQILWKCFLLLTILSMDVLYSNLKFSSPRASVKISSQAIPATSGMARITQEVYKHTWWSLRERYKYTLLSLFLLLILLLLHYYYYNWNNFLRPKFLGFYNAIICIFSSDEPILCYQRSSFFPLAEERRVSVTEAVNEAFENDKQLKLGLKMGFTMLLILLYCAFRFCMFASIKFLPGHVVLTNLKVLFGYLLIVSGEKIEFMDLWTRSIHSSYK